MPELKQRPKPEERQAALSNQAMDFLRKQGYSQRFISNVSMMLREAENKNRNADLHVYPQSAFSKPGQKTGPISMPTSLSGRTTESPADKEYGMGNKPIMPDIGIYSPTTSYTPDVFRAFASREGQRFMKREYNQLRRDPASGQWNVEQPKTSLGSLVPKKTIDGIPKKI